MRVSILVGALLAACVIAIAGNVQRAGAQSAGLTADQYIAIRKAGQDLVGANFADMKRAVDAHTMDVKPFKDNANAIVAWFKVFPSLFPPGTDKGDTKALPAVWSDRAGFEKAAADVRTAAAALARAADSNDSSAFAAAFQETGKACGACHRNYRQRTS